PMELPKISTRMETLAVKRIDETRRGLLTLSASQPNTRVEINPSNAKELSRKVACCWLMPFHTIIGMKWVEIAWYEAFLTPAPNTNAQKANERIAWAAVTFRSRILDCTDSLSRFTSATCSSPSGLRPMLSGEGRIVRHRGMPTSKKVIPATAAPARQPQVCTMMLRIGASKTPPRP